MAYRLCKGGKVQLHSRTRWGYVKHASLGFPLMDTKQSRLCSPNATEVAQSKFQWQVRNPGCLIMQAAMVSSLGRK
jgi:hypothetical protein